MVQEKIELIGREYNGIFVGTLREHYEPGESGCHGRYDEPQRTNYWDGLANIVGSNIQKDFRFETLRYDMSGSLSNIQGVAGFGLEANLLYFADFGRIVQPKILDSLKFMDYYLKRLIEAANKKSDFVLVVPLNISDLRKERFIE